MRECRYKKVLPIGNKLEVLFTSNRSQVDRGSELYFLGIEPMPSVYIWFGIRTTLSGWTRYGMLSELPLNSFGSES